MPKPVYEEGEVTVLWNQAVHTDREVTANRPDIIILQEPGWASKEEREWCRQYNVSEIHAQQNTYVFKYYQKSRLENFKNCNNS
jgi:hypothetical protein